MPTPHLSVTARSVWRVGVRAIVLAALAVAPAGAQRPAGILAADSAERVAVLAPDARPRPYPVFESDAFAHAVARGTRTRTGVPGPRYWEQFAHYTLEARLDPRTARLDGRGEVMYYNRSPDTLRSVFVHLRQNLYAPGVPRTRPVPLTGGVHLQRVTVDGRDVPADSGARRGGYRVSGTVAELPLARPLVPGDSVRLGFAWWFTVPPRGAYRIGQDGEIFFVGYWYPQMVVYDDISGWHDDPYLGNAEFYMDYADYDVAITVPSGFLVGATGVLANPDDVLSPVMRARLARVRDTAGVVHVVTANERASAAAAGLPRTWRFHAHDVRDFAFATSHRYVWDATRAIIGGPDGAVHDTVVVNALYRPEARWWTEAARYARTAVEFHSRALWPYPYPHITAAEGIVGGMEFPMIVHINAPRDSLGLFGVLAHEIGHEWFPMQVGSDEKRYSWMDEGFTTFDEAAAINAFTASDGALDRDRQRYLRWARTGREVEIMRHGDRYPVGSPAFSTATYSKTAAVLGALHELLGDSAFYAAFRAYGRAWVGKHPQPYDFWNTFDRGSPTPLWWFWRSWFFETWRLDQAIAGATVEGDSLAIVIEDRGRVPMPVPVTVTRSDGSTQQIVVPVSVWLSGARATTLRVADPATVRSVEIDPDGAYPDLDRSNQRWTP